MFGILLLTFLTEIYLANVFFYGAAPGPGESVSTGPRVPGRTQRIFHQILVREFLFVFLLFLLTFTMVFILTENHIDLWQLILCVSNTNTKVHLYDVYVTEAVNFVKIF